MTEFRVVRYIYCTSDDYDSSMIKYHGNTPAINQLKQIDILNIRNTHYFNILKIILNANEVCYS